MQEEKRTKARANYNCFVAGIHSVRVNEWHCSLIVNLQNASDQRADLLREPRPALY
jgi:hypothetical protein